MVWPKMSGGGSVVLARRLQVLHGILLGGGYGAASRLVWKKALGRISAQRCAASFNASSEASHVSSPPRLVASELPPASHVTLDVSVAVEEENLEFESRNYFRTSEEGTLDVSKADALEGGTYKGVDPFGPFWTMRPTEKSSSILFRLQKLDNPAEIDFKLRLWKGHVGQDEEKGAELLTESVVKRSFLPPGVERVPVKTGRARGTLFLPPANQRPASGSGRLPLVVTIYGGIFRGHVIEEKAAMLAGEGFAAFALSFFGTDESLPKRYHDLEMEFFEDSINEVCQLRPDLIDKDRIGLIGVSKGGDICLSASYFLGDKIKACVAINTCIASVQGNTTYKGRTLPGVGFDPTGENVSIRDDGSINMLGVMNTFTDEEVIPFWESPAHLLFLVADDDHNYEVIPYSDRASDFLRGSPKPDSEWRVIRYPGAGHLLNVPGMPPTFTSLHPLAPKGVYLYMGGQEEPRLHHQAEIKAWEDQLSFMKEKLSL